MTLDTFRVAAQETRNGLVGSTETFSPTEAVCLSAWATMSTGRRGYWNARLVNSAAEAGCTVFFRADKQDTDRVAGVEIVDAFGEAGALSERARQLLELR